jgi:hypothetical protein
VTDQSNILKKWHLIRPYLSRRQRGLWAAAEAEAFGFGGGKLLASVTGISLGCIGD